MLDMRYQSVNIGYRIHKISCWKCAYDMVYDINCLYYDIVCQPRISYVDIRYHESYGTKNPDEAAAGSEAAQS